MLLGKLPAAPKPTDFKLADVLSTGLPTPPPHGFGFGHLFADWGMLGNDSQGDCVWAGGDHETMLFNRLAGKLIPFDDQVALQDYHDCTGPGDNGTDVHVAMGYRKNIGLLDAGGQRHKIDAYVSIDPKNFELMRACAFTFGAVGLGIEFPSSAMDQFRQGRPWDVVAGSPIEGGHYIPAVGSMNDNEVTVVTWGRRQEMTRAFYEEYNDEAWVPLSFEMMKANGYGLHHIDQAKLQALFNTLP